MTKAISAGMTAHLAQDTTKLATCIEMTLRSGTIFRFSDHPKDIVFNDASGVTDGADDPILLIDSTAAFQTNGIEVGAVVTNSTDGSTGTVVSIDSQVQITTSALTGGTEDDWDTGDAYTIAGVTFLASVGHETTDPVARNNLAVDGMELTLLLDNPGLLEGDLLAGLYDYADYKLFMLNYESPAALGDIKLMRGQLGEVSSSRGVTATVELRGLTQNLQKLIGEKYSPDCPVELTDARCGVTLAPIDWEADGARVTGDLRSPTTANGRQFISTRIGKSGPTEPTWDIVIGNLTTEVDTATGTTTAVPASTYDGPGHATLLEDATALFITWGVRPGDPIRNVTDGSAGTVVTVNSETRIQGSALDGGLNDAWVTADAYAIDLSGAVTDSAATFITDGVQAGAILLNTTDGSTTTIKSVDSETKITIDFNVETDIGLSGGADNFFQLGDGYSIAGAQWRTRDAFTKFGTVTSFTDAQNFRSSSIGTVADGIVTAPLSGVTDDGISGTVTGADSSTVLIDSAALFQTDGASLANIMRNTTDGSDATVATVDSEIQITSTALANGSDNLWQAGDSYEIETRVTLVDSTAMFLTDQVQIGEAVRNITDGSDGTVVSIDSETQLQTTQLFGGPGDRLWQIGDAYEIDTATILNDSAATFIAAGVLAGDVVENITDGSTALVLAVNSETQIRSATLTGGMNNIYTTNDEYGVAQSFIIGTGTTTGASDPLILIDSAATFIADNVVAGDIIRNTTDGGTCTVITFNQTQINCTALLNGVDNNWDTGDAYVIHRQTNGAGSWQYGEVTWLTGANANLTMEVKTNTQAGVIELFLPMAFAIAEGDTFNIAAGCDKLIKTCRVKFENLINFQGFPTVPSPDTLYKVGGHDSGRASPEFGS